MSRPESHITRRVARLDEQGLAEMSEVVTQVVDKLVEIEKRSVQRLRRHKSQEIPTVLIAMLFDAPDDDVLDGASGDGGAGHETRRRARATGAGRSGT
jgi:hypothetical protein